MRSTSKLKVLEMLDSVPLACTVGFNCFSRFKRRQVRYCEGALMEESKQLKNIFLPIVKNFAIITRHLLKDTL